MVALALAGLAALFAIMAALAAYLMTSQRQGAKTEEPQEEEEATVIGVSTALLFPACCSPASQRLQHACHRSSMG